MQFNLRSFLDSACKPYETEFAADMSGADFGAFTLNTPAQCTFTATPTENGAALLLCVKADVRSECARCLEPLSRSYDFEREYFVRRRDLDEIGRASCRERV